MFFCTSVSVPFLSGFFEFFNLSTNNLALSTVNNSRYYQDTHLVQKSGMTSLPSLRRLRSGGGLGFILSGTVALLVHCSWVLLNGSSVIYRLWTVLGKPYPSLLCVESVARRLTRVPLLFQQLYVQSVPSSHSYGLSYSNKQSIFQ